MASGTRRQKQLALSQSTQEPEVVTDTSSSSSSSGEDEVADSKYKAGDRVLCYEPDSTKARVLYDARVLELRKGKKKRGENCMKEEYLMHFVGWSNNWDCWVDESSILKDTDAGREIQRRANRVANRSIKKEESNIFRNKEVGTRGKKRHRKFHDSDEDSDFEQVTSTRYSSKDSEISESECSTSTVTETTKSKSKHHGKASQLPEKIILNIPAALKAALLKDMNQISVVGAFLKLPRSPNVKEILTEYFKKKIEAFPGQEGIYGEIVDGIKIYFDFLVGDQLLYEPELPQFKRFFPQSRTKPLLIACAPDYIKYAPITKIDIPFVVNRDRATSSTAQGVFLKPASKPQKEKDSYTLPSEVYGIEHFARLFVHLPEYMNKADIPRKHYLLLSSHLQDLLDYISNNLSRYQESEVYEKPSSGSKSTTVK